jgi:hypothetical protein
MGVVWSTDSSFAPQGDIHREQLADLPLSIDSHREMTHLAE